MLAWLHHQMGVELMLIRACYRRGDGVPEQVGVAAGPQPTAGSSWLGSRTAHLSHFIPRGEKPKCSGTGKGWTIKKSHLGNLSLSRIVSCANCCGVAPVFSSHPIRLFETMLVVPRWPGPVFVGWCRGKEAIQRPLFCHVPMCRHHRAGKMEVHVERIDTQLNMSGSWRTD